MTNNLTISNTGTGEIRRITSVDIGLTNFGMTKIDTRSLRILHAVHLSIKEFGGFFGKKNPGVKNIVEIMHDIVETYPSFFRDTDMLIVEAQMRSNMKIICTALLSSFRKFGKPIDIVSAHFAHLHFRTPSEKLKHMSLTKSRRYTANKKLSVNTFKKYMRKLDDIFFSRAFGKNDHIADAYCQAVYYVEKRLIKTPSGYYKIPLKRLPVRSLTRKPRKRVVRKTRKRKRKRKPVKKKRPRKKRKLTTVK